MFAVHRHMAQAPGVLQVLVEGDPLGADDISPSLASRQSIRSLSRQFSLRNKSVFYGPISTIEKLRKECELKDIPDFINTYSIH